MASARINYTTKVVKIQAIVYFPILDYEPD